MSKSNPLPEFSELATQAGFVTVGVNPRAAAFWNADRVEGFSLLLDEDGAFLDATWHGRVEMRTFVDRRAPGGYGKNGRSLVGSEKNRPRGVGDVRAEAISMPQGISVLYTELKRRIKNKNWREK